MEHESAIEREALDRCERLPGAGAFLPAIGIIEPERDVEKTWAALFLPNESLNVPQGGLRNADDRARLSEAGKDPALEVFPSRGGRRIGHFAERAAHREQVVAGDDDRPVANPPAVHGVGMIADVNELDPMGNAPLQLAREEEKLVDVAEPFGDEAARPPYLSEEWPGRDQLCRYARRR